MDNKPLFLIVTQEWYEMTDAVTDYMESSPHSVGHSTNFTTFYWENEYNCVEVMQPHSISDVEYYFMRHVSLGDTSCVVFADDEYLNNIHIQNLLKSYRWPYANTAACYMQLDVNLPPK